MASPDCRRPKDTRIERGKTLSVGIVGGGPGCKAIMDMILAEKLRQLRMKLIGVACTNHEAEGYRYAKSKEIYTTSDYRDLYQLTDLNMIIELTGREDVANEISRTKPSHIRLIDHVGAHVFWDLFQIEEEGIAERKQAGEQVIMQNAVLDAINMVLQETLVCENDEEVARACLSVAEKLTDSKLGIIGEVNQAGLFDAIAISDTGWARCRMPKTDAVTMVKDMEIRGFLGKAIKDEQSIIVNDPGSHPESVGTPEWHPPITSYLGVPLKQSGRTIGMISLANKESGYDLTDQQAVEKLSVAFVEALNRKRAEGRLRESEEKYRSLFQNSRDAIYMTSRDGRFIDVNYFALDLFGYTKEEMIGLDVLKIYVNPEDRHRFQEEIEQYGSVRDYEVKFRKKDGAEMDCLLTSTVRCADDGSVLGYQGIIRNVTDRKRLEAQLQQVQKMEALGTLAGGIAHDFNNLLMPILINTQIALTDIPDGSSAQKLLEKVLKAGNRAKDLVSQILTFSRQAEQEQQPAQMRVIVNETLRLLRSTLPSTIKINEQIQTPSDTVIADPSQMHQIVLNLCTNAAHAMREKGGVLEVTLTDINLDSEDAAAHPDLSEGRYVRLTVNDTGHGMEPTVMERIFDPFFTTKTMGEGTGLGLSTVHGIVKSHGGAIAVDSKPHQGSTFHVYLPLSDIVVADKRPMTEPVPTGTEHILLVDDEEWVVTAAQLMIERLGYKVTALTSSLGALAAFRAQPQEFDLVITDITMPQMTGEVLARQLTAIRPSISIIICTGYSDRISRERAEEIGIAAYVMKPINVNEMAKTIRRVLDKTVEE